MDLRAIARGYSPALLLQLDHSVLPRSAVLCAKLLALLWLITGQVVYLRAQVTPFGGVSLSWLPETMRALPWLQLAMLGQLAAILTILCSVFVRVGCAALSLLIVVLSLIDQPLFSNNRLFCAALLCMLALDRTPHLKLVRAQIALVYACAAFDKLLDADWRSGVFLHSFVSNLCRTGELWSPGWTPGTPLPLTCALSHHLQSNPSGSAWLSMGVIGIEATIAVCYARCARLTAPLAVIFHCALFALTGSTFGMFFYAVTTAALVSLDLERLPKPFDRAWPYFALAIGVAGPWVRPWHAAALALMTLALLVYVARERRMQVAHDRR